MNQRTTTGIILGRTDYGEADRILTVLTPESGKLRLMAKGVRRIKSKLAGGIELFSTTDLTYIQGRGDMGTVMSTRLIRFYNHITSDINRTMLGYDLIKQLNKITEDEPEPEYFALMEAAFAALDNAAIDIDLIRLWFGAQLLQLGGHMPNLRTEADGAALDITGRYEFSFDDSAFFSRPGGPFFADDIKFLRIVFAGNSPETIMRVSGVNARIAANRQLLQLLVQQHLRI